MPSAPYGVRKGDRFEWCTPDGTTHRITVSSIARNRRSAQIQVLQVGSGSRWTKRQALPFPGGFIKVHSEPPEICEFCDYRKPLPGMLYCDECIDTVAELGGNLPGEDDASNGGGT